MNNKCCKVHERESQMMIKDACFDSFPKELSCWRRSDIVRGTGNEFQTDSSVLNRDLSY